jgi:hypothetical protein
MSHLPDGGASTLNRIAAPSALLPKRTSPMMEKTTAARATSNLCVDFSSARSRESPNHTHDSIDESLGGGLAFMHGIYFHFGAGIRVLIGSSYLFLDRDGRCLCQERVDSRNY